MKYKKIYLEITNQCNLKCDFCIQNKRNSKFMEKQDFLTILDKIKDYTNYLYFHVLGEPLLHPSINEFIDEASSRNFFVNITTNGYLIKRIKDNKNIRQLNISLHSFDDKYLVLLDNYLDNIFDVVDELIKNNTYVSFRLWVKNKYHKEIINKINEHYNTNINYDIKDYKINNNLFINNFHEFIWPNLNNEFYEEKGTCYALRDHIGILVDGTIIPCCLDTLGNINFGNILNNNLESIINSDRYQNMLEGFKCNEKREELCKHCGFLNTK